MRAKVFLSSSFSPRDIPVVERFKALLTQLGLECRQGRDVGRVLDGVIEEIRRCELFVAVLTSKAPAGAVGTDGHEVSTAVNVEIGAALAFGKQPVIFREDTVALEGFYSDIEQKPFNRGRLLGGDQAEVTDISQTVARLFGRQGYEVGAPPKELLDRYEFARTLAMSSGSTILGYYRDTLYHNRVRDRAVKNYPTDADEHANRLIETTIKNDYLTRHDTIISEESIKDVETLKSRIEESEYVWIVDPLDGTLNFAYGFSYFCVSIGLLRDREPILGVVYDPPATKLYCGLSGYPSECFDLATGSKTTLALKSNQKELENCIVMSHLSGHAEARAKTISVLDQIMDRCRSMRFLGSGQMALISLSLGQFDIFFNYRTNIWDIVPGYVILKGAGGYASSSLQEPDSWDWKSRGIVAASNKDIGEEFTKFLRSKLKSDFPSL